MDIMPSITRMMMESASREKPEIRPMNNPAAEARMATEKPTMSETRAP